MTEEMVERVAEKRMDRLDERFMAGKMTQAEYDAAVKELDKWVRLEVAFDRAR